MIKLKNLITEQWSVGTDDRIYLWKLLYNTLKKSKIPVKYGAKGKQVTDPKISTFMYWSGWVIWKDINTNGGWPISFTDSENKMWLFKFKDGIYNGQQSPYSIILKSKNFKTPVALGTWALVSTKNITTSFNNFQKSERAFGKCKHCNDRTYKNILSLSSPMKEKAMQFIDTVYKNTKEGLTITDTYRTAEQQRDLYAKGRTKPGKTVTNAKPGESYHNYGLAFDVYFNAGSKIDNTVDLSRTMTADIAKYAEKLGLSWGGSWESFKDYPHFELKSTAVDAKIEKAKKSNKK
jgi:hypothetical protein